MSDRSYFEETYRKHAEYVNEPQARVLRFAGWDTVIERGEGSWLIAYDGTRYLDLQACYGAVTLGHSHPELVAALTGQAAKLGLRPHASFNRPLVDLAERLAQLTPGRLQFSFLCNSGTEAVEGALKVARAATGRPGFVSTIDSYHGKSLGALSVSGRAKYQAPFRPLLPGAKHVPWGDLEELRAAVGEDTAAVILEPIQGEGGVNLPPDGYLRGAQEIAHERGALFILDEVQTGFGRAGAPFAANLYGLEPDLMTVAKGLGGGLLAAGAFIGTPEVWKVFDENPWLHSSTFGGAPLACAVGLKVLEISERERVWDRARDSGAYLLERLRAIQVRFPDLVKDVRGIGLLVAVEFPDDDRATLVISEMALRKTFLTYSLNQPKVIRISPPLTVTIGELDFALRAFEESLAAAEELLRTLA
jgi:putrescine aminotransferase